MTNENTEIVVSHQEIDLKVEAKKQLRIATVDFLSVQRNLQRTLQTALLIIFESFD